jgi:hypothetical protein
MLFDINLILAILVIATWSILLVVVFYPSDCNDSKIDQQRLQHEIEIARKIQKDVLNGLKNTEDFIGDESEQENTNEHRMDDEDAEQTEKVETYNNDSASVLPIKLNGLLSEEQNKTFPKNSLYHEKPLLQNIDKRVFNNGTFNDRQFFKPLPYSSKNINDFVAFLGSTYNSMNNKYRVNANGPLL